MNPIDGVRGWSFQNPNVLDAITMPPSGQLQFHFLDSASSSRVTGLFHVCSSFQLTRRQTERNEQAETQQVDCHFTDTLSTGTLKEANVFNVETEFIKQGFSYQRSDHESYNAGSVCAFTFSIA